METDFTVLKFFYNHNDMEWQNKIGDLLKYFCNNVFLGQWELARCAVPILIGESSEVFMELDARLKYEYDEDDTDDSDVISDDIADIVDISNIERNTKIFNNMLNNVTQYPFSQRFDLMFELDYITDVIKIYPCSIINATIIESS